MEALRGAEGGGFYIDEGGFELFNGAGDDEDVSAFAGELLSDTFAHALGSTGDDDGLKNNCKL